MKPFIREYSNDEKLQNDVQTLASKGIKKDNIYVMSHDDDRTERIAKNADANTVGVEETGISDAVGNMFNKKGDELRSKLQELGFSEEEAEDYEEDLDEGKVLLMVTETQDIENII